MKNGVIFFVERTVYDIEKEVNDFLSKNDVEIISFTEIRKYDMDYCFCLVYKEVNSVNKTNEPIIIMADEKYYKERE